MINGGPGTQTTSTQTYGDAVLLDSNTTLDSARHGGHRPHTFQDLLDSGAGETNSLLVNTSGTTRFNGAVGGTDRLSSLTTDAGRGHADRRRAILTTGTQTYGDAVLLDSATTLDSSAAGDVTFQSTLDSVAGETNSLLVNTSGTTRFNGAVGAADRLSSLTTDAGGTTQIDGGSINTTAAQTFNDAVLLASGTTLTSSGAGDVTFNSPLDSVTGENNA